MNESPHFGQDYFFKDAELTAAVKVSEVFNLGRTNGGIRIRAWAEGAITTSAGKTITFAVETADAADAAAWDKVKQETFTAKGTAETGTLFTYIPDTAARFVRVSVTGSDGTTGKISVAPEYLPR